MEIKYARRILEKLKNVINSPLPLSKKSEGGWIHTSYGKVAFFFDCHPCSRILKREVNVAKTLPANKKCTWHPGGFRHSTHTHTQFYIIKSLR